MSNNISEGSGSNSDKEFCHFLNIAHRSTFENANILILLQRKDLIDQVTLDLLLLISHFVFSAAKHVISVARNLITEDYKFEKKNPDCEMNF